MGRKLASPSQPGDLSMEEMAELGALTERVQQGLRRTAEDIIAIGADLIRAKALSGHGRFGSWLDVQFSLSRRSAEQFMAAARRFGGKSEAVSLLPAGVILELSAPSVPDELVQGQVLEAAEAFGVEVFILRGGWWHGVFPTLAVTS